MIKAAQGVPRALVVEDNNFVALEAKDILGSAGYTVLGIAASGKQALASAATHAPALVPVDASLVGDMDGIESADQLLALGVRTTFANGHANPEPVAGVRM